MRYVRTSGMPETDIVQDPSFSSFGCRKEIHI